MHVRGKSERTRLSPSSLARREPPHLGRSYRVYRPVTREIEAHSRVVGSTQTQLADDNFLMETTFVEKLKDLEQAPS